MKRGWAVCVALGLLAGGSTAWAQVPIQSVLLRNSFNPFGAGARGLGMGGAFIAVADDGTASSFNPAGLAQLRSSELVVVGFYDDMRSDITQAGVQGAGRGNAARRETSQHQSLDFVGLAVPFEAGGRNLTVQLSYQRAVDLFGEGQTDSVFFERADKIVTDPLQLAALGLRSNQWLSVGSAVVPRQRGAFHLASAAVAYQVTSRLSLGAALNYWVGEWKSEGSVGSSIEIPGPAPQKIGAFNQTFSQDQSLRGFNVNAGFLLKYSRVSLGGVVRMPFTGDYRLDETGHREDYLLGKQVASTPTDARMTSSLDWPLSAGLGLAVRPFRGLTLSAEASVFKWSRTFVEDVPDGALLTPGALEGEETELTDRSFFDMFPAALTTAADTWQWRAGGEYLVSLPKVVVPLRAGLFRDRSPVVAIGSDTGREIEGWTVGTGLNFSRLVLDVAFERREASGLVGFRSRPGMEEGTLDFSGSPTEEVRDDRIVASVIYRPGGDKDPLKRAFKFLFVGASDEEKPAAGE